MSFLYNLTEAGAGADRGLFALAVSLPKADIVEQLVDMVIKALFAFLRAPYLNAVLDEPLDNKGRFIGDIDGDGDITIVDTTFLQRYLARIQTPYPIGEKMT